MRPKQQSALRKLFSPNSLLQQIKFYYVSGTKVSLRRYTGIYRHIQAFAFKVLQVCGSWASRNDALQMFFLTPNTNRNMFAGKFVKSERFLAVLREHIVSSELRFVKWVRFFEQNCSVKWVIFFASFCWLSDFLVENLKLKRRLMISTGTCGRI